jgi:hypothetical protein
MAIMTMNKVREVEKRVGGHAIQKKKIYEKNCGGKKLKES